MAEYNLSKEPRLAEAKEQLARTYEQGVEIQKAYEKDKQQLGESRMDDNCSTGHNFIVLCKQVGLAFAMWLIALQITRPENRVWTRYLLC